MVAQIKIGITQFVLRQWESGFRGTRIVGIAPEELARMAEESLANGALLVEGYAPFCKHLFLRNSTPIRTSVARITDGNRHLLRSGYEARRIQELPVLCRWFEGLDAPRAEWLDVILYSRVQLELEGDTVDGADWGVVAVNGELEPVETPMSPATMLRNALGISEGGSGVPLDRAAYLRSVEFWQTHAVIR